MRLTQLRYFEAAVRLGSLRAAAEELRVSQPTLSEQLRALEEELGVVLLVRGRRGVTTTTAGATILDRVHEVLAGETAIKQEASAIAGLSHGITRIGAISVTAWSFVPTVMRQLAQDHPGLQFQLIESGSFAIEEEVRRGELDVGLVARLPTAKAVAGLTEVPLLTTRVLAALPVGHPLAALDIVTPDQLAGYPLVLFPRGFLLRNTLEEYFGQRQLPMVVQAGNVDTLRVMIGAGLGVALETELGIHHRTPESDRMCYVPFTGPPHEVEIRMLYRTTAQPSRAALAVMTHMRRAAARWRPPRGAAARVRR